MTTKIREYVTKMPYSVHDWRKGQRYVLAKYTTDDVEIIGIKKRQEEGKVITESHKLLSMGKWLPMVVKKILNENALLVEEFSTNIDVLDNGVLKVEKRVKAQDGMLDEMKVEKTQEAKKVKDIGELEIKDVKEDMDKRIIVALDKVVKNIKNSSDDKESSTSKSTESVKSVKSAKSVKSSKSAESVKSIKSLKSNNNLTLESACETSYINKYYDVGTFSLTIKTIVKDEKIESPFGTDPDKVQSFDLSSGKDGCFLYRLITVTVNSMMLGWIADRVKNSVRDMLGKFHEKVIETENEWKEIKEEDLIKLEEEMIKKFVKKA